ncbi:amidohydrolase [Martelella sp. HB161492]|uniref:amidohydrolase family protein n=1 Tax=Martelella sp. HB161492 TaxID=2720726 RepID=UPI0015919C9D|nr:amidohydrolase [Martelella sp. HB161492]
MRILDTHLHLVEKDRFSYPWLTGAPALDRTFSAAAYFAEAEQYGIEAALHMEVDVAEQDMAAETRFMLSAHPKIAGAIAACRPEDPGFPAYLEEMAAVPGVKGFRRVLHVVPDDISQTPLFAENLNRLAPLGLSFDLCVSARQLPLAIDLAKKCPDVQFILDHCGVPDIEGGGLDPWRNDMSEISRIDNVAAKISGVIAYGGKDWSVAGMRPYVEHVIAAFGFDRIVWGSDFPVCTLTASLKDWVAATKMLIAGASAEEQERLFSRNAMRIYKI